MAFTTRPPAEGSQQAADPQEVRPVPRPAVPEENDFDPLALVLPLWRRKWIIVLFAFVAIAAGLYLVSRQEHHYTAEARIIFEPERLRIIDLRDVVAPEAGQDAMRNQIEVLRSSLVLERVIDNLRLDRQPEFALPERAPHPLDGSWIQQLVSQVNWPPIGRSVLRRTGLLAHSPETLSREEQTDKHVRHMLKLLSEGLQLRAITGSRVIQIGYSSTDPALAAAIANAAAEQYIILQTERRRDDIAQATELLSIRVRDLENRLLRADEAVQVAELELAAGTEHGSSMISGQIGSVTQALAEAGRVRSMAEERLGRASQAVDTGEDLYVVPEFLGSSVIAAYRQRETELLDQEVSMRSLVTNANNPTLVRIQARLAEVRRNIEVEAGRIITGLAAELEGARALEERLTAELAELEQRGLEQARAEMRLSRLQREAQAVRSMYDTFLARMNETMEQTALQAPEARFLSRALRPDAPDTRYAQMLLGGAAAVGIGLAVALILLLERLNDTFRRTRDIEARTGLNVLAGIPRTGKRSEPKDLLASLLGKPNSPLAESARNLRTSILFSNIDQAPKVIMFASSVAGEGKTTTAILTAVTSQQMERSAVIVDCDLRRGTLGRIFRRDPEQPGLFAALQGTAPIEEAVHVEPETGLHVLAPERIGHGLGNPADILASRRFQRLLSQLKARYDLVILDTPPVLAVADPRILAQSVDAVVYLVRWNGTRQGAVVEGLRDLHSVNAKIAGIAMTQVDERQAKKYLGGDYLYKQSYA
jgi:polysaccharide biosynthesis transport protein